MAKARKTRQFRLKKIISAKDARVTQADQAKKEREDPSSKAPTAQAARREKTVRRSAPVSSALFFRHNEQLGPPYHVLLDTNFINFSIANKLDVLKSLTDCLFAKVTPYITDCVMAELEKLGPKYHVAMRVAKDPRFERLPCAHKGTYADDCLVRRVIMHKCYIVATCDRDLRRRIRKVPGVPIMYITQHRYSVERMPEALGAPRTG